ncbi:MAG: CHAP domain-containing protein [Solirubrobacteraceae bacterium]
MSSANPTATLLRAQELALNHDERLATLALDPIRRGVPSLNITQRITRARATLTIEGASTLELDVYDPDWHVERSGLLDITHTGRMNAIAIAVDSLRFRLVKASRQDPDVLTLTFEDEVVALLRAPARPLAASRGSITRAQFIERQVGQVKARDIPFDSPEGLKRQRTALPDYPDSRPAAGQTGFDDGTRVKIKGQTADAAQMRELATALGVAGQENAGPRPTLAMVVSGIGESGFRAVPNAAGSPYAGVFQAHPDNIPMKDTAQQARFFLKGGKGFQSGGAIAAARENPGWSAGTIAYKVEGSRANFGSDALAERHYQQHADEARKIIAAYGGADGAATSEVIRAKAYLFRRLKNESRWDSAVRLAEEVRWRLYAQGGVVSFVSDDYLISKPAALIIDSITAPGLLEAPTYDWDHGKTIAELDLRVSANRWGLRAGEVVALRNLGPVTGRWIINTVEFDLLAAAATQVRLTKPVAELKEPAHELITTSGGGGAAGGGGGGELTAGAQRAVAWARSKIGDYKENQGPNRGAELDALERTFNFQGAPWCAMFTSTALVEGGVSRDCRTAAVAQVRNWAQAGTNGYTRGFRATPKPGDLVCFGTAHIGFVEKVSSTTVTTIEGNTSANQVARRTRRLGEGDYVRPDYPN